jgi:hypothetical protein
VTALSYRITYDAATETITAAAVDAVVTTVSQPTGTCGTQVISVPLAVAVAWVPDAATVTAMGASFAASDEVPYERSGYPGYAPGLPVLAGVLVSHSGACVCVRAWGQRDDLFAMCGPPLGFSLPHAY